jgi:BirA family biotin operon repressor/biotin-[acetyl-CoA-carboxylase] ligase
MGSDLSLDAIQQGLTTRLIGSNLIYYLSVSSTQDIAREAAVKGADEGTTIVAEEQTKGRARLGRTWINPPGVVAVSIILHPEMSQLTRLTVMASLAK